MSDGNQTKPVESPSLDSSMMSDVETSSSSPDIPRIVIAQPSSAVPEESSSSTTTSTTSSTTTSSSYSSESEKSEESEKKEEAKEEKKEEVKEEVKEEPKEEEEKGDINEESTDERAEDAIKEEEKEEVKEEVKEEPKVEEVKEEPKEKKEKKKEKKDKKKKEKKEEKQEIIEAGEFTGVLQEHHLRRYQAEGETLAKLYETASHYDKKAYTNVEKKHQDKMWNTFIEDIDKAACGILKHEEVHGVIICMNNTDSAYSLGMASILTGKYVTYIQPTMPTVRIEKAIEMTHADLAFVDNGVLDQFRTIMKTNDKLKVVVVGTDVGKNGQLVSLAPFIADKVDKEEFKEAMKKLKPDTIAEIVAVPEGDGFKGVIWTHGNIMAAIEANNPGLTEEMTIMEVLPNASFGERLFAMYIAMAKQLHVYIAQPADLQFGGAKFVKLLKKIKPRFMLGVPRVYEKLSLRAEEQVRKAGLLTKATKEFAAKKGVDGGVKQGVGESKPKGYGFSRALVYNKALKALGLHKCYCACWGVIKESVRNRLLGLGITVFEGLMLPETCGYCLTNKKDTYVPGLYGSRLEGINVELNDDEIVVSGPVVSPGYCNESKEHIYNYNGGFKTGILASTSKYGKKKIDFFIPKGYKRPMIVTSNSDFIEPHYIEMNLRKIPTVTKAMVLGESEKFVIAFFEVDYQKMKEELKEKCPPENQIRVDPFFGTFLRQRVEAFNQTLPRSYRVKKFVIVDLNEVEEDVEKDTSVENRQKVAARYQKGIKNIYDPPHVAEQNDEKKRREEEKKIQKQRHKEEKEREKADKAKLRAEKKAKK